MTEPSRTQTVTQKIDGRRTGFKGSIFVHVDHLDGRVVAVRLSEKGKDDSTLDRLLHAIGDDVTDILNKLQCPTTSGQ